MIVTAMILWSDVIRREGWGTSKPKLACLPWNLTFRKTEPTVPERPSPQAAPVRKAI